MNHTVCLVLLFLAFAPAPGHWPESFPVTSRYDHSTDTTTAQIEVFIDDTSPVHLTLHANAAFRGREPNESGRFWFTLSVTQGHVSRKAPPLLEANGTLLLALDATQLRAPLTDYRREYYELIQRVSESAHIAIERTDLPRLLAAQKLSGQSGKAEFKLSAAALTALKEFITRQALATQPQ